MAQIPEAISAPFEWRSPAEGTVVTIEAEIVEQLRQRVFAGVRALPKRGMEVGGILLGRIRHGDPHSVTVEQAEPISCEHPLGPAFILSESDRAQLSRQMEELRQGELEIIGYYRSCTGREIGLDEGDQGVLDEFWPEPHHVILLLQPISLQECMGAFLFRRNGGLPSAPEHQPFPFRLGASVPVAEPPTRSAEERQTLAEQPQEVVGAEPALTLPAGEARAARRRRYAEAEPRRQTWRWAVAALVLAVALLAGRELWLRVSEPAWTELGLNVSPTGSGLEVTWNPSIPELQNARWGVLTITESGSDSEVELNRAALAHGTFTYRGSGNDVLVRLRVGVGSGATAGETFRFVSQGKPAPVAAPAVGVPGAATAEAASQSSPADAKEPPSPAQTPDTEIQGAASDGLAAPRAEQDRGLGTTAPVKFAAKAVHQVQPYVSEGIRSRIQERVVVPVVVRISASGKVLSASPQADGDTVYRYLAARAAQAAKLWRFQPARSADGKPAESTKALFFAFHP